MNHFKSTNPPEGLNKAILARIDTEIARKAQFNVWFFRLTSLASVFVSILTLENFIVEFYRSGLNQYLFLALSDFGTLLTYWNEFLLSVVEVFPAIALAIFLSTGLFAIWSFGKSTSMVKTKFLLA